MPGVPRNLIEHSLNVDPKATPKRQHLCRFADDRRNAIKEELAKLLAAGFIRDVFHPEWLANPVLVRKKNSNEWRMCVDYTDLNKHCPKEPFGLPWIDQVIDSTAGCELLCFLDCYSGYHQIAIKEEDQEKTAFITPFGAYYYTTMSFGLKNAAPPTSELSRPDSRDSSTRTSKPTWMTWLSRLEIPTCSSPILKRLSHPYERAAGSSTRTSASLAYCLENYSASSSATATLKPTPRKSPPSPIWELQPASRMSRSLPGAWRP
jgi:hypothetical protein